MNMKQKQFTSLRSSTQEEYGQVQTLCDIIKAVNEEKHFKSTQEVSLLARRNQVDHHGKGFHHPAIPL